MDKEILTEEDVRAIEGALTLPEDMAEATDFEASEAIKINKNVKLPSSFSLGKWIYKTSNQGSLGACFDGGVKVLMGDFSYDAIKDIRVGDVVQTFEGPKQVLKTFLNGEREMLSIKLKKLRGNKSDIRCTEDHKFYVYEDGKEITKEAKNLKEGDRLMFPIYNIDEKDLDVLNISDYLDGDIMESQDGKYLIKIVGKTQSKLPKEIPLTNELLQLFGFYVAEGCVNFYEGKIHGITLTFHQDETDFIQFCIDELSKITQGNGIYTHQKKNSKAFSIKVNNSLLGILFNNLFNHLCYNKTIPDFIYNLPIERFRYFLNALVKGDGYYTKGSNEIGISITGCKVMNLISNKLNYNGISHSFEIRNNSVETQERADIYGIYLYGDAAVWLMPEELTHNELSIDRDSNEYVTIGDNRYITKPIKSIESIGKFDAYNIEVEGNHTYCVNNVKVHNCTSLGTTHGVQILNVKKGGVEPTTKNIITPKRKDLWAKMGHSTTQYDGGDYVEKAVSTALKEGILIEENGELARFDAYATDSWDRNDASIEMMKRYLYAGCPIVWSIRGNKQTWTEMTKGQITTTNYTPTGGHCIALVGRDESGMRFVNSWSTNDGKGLKSRFHIPYSVMKQLGSKLNYRYWVLYIKEDGKKDAEYLKRKNTHKVIIEALKKYYPEESAEVKKGIEAYSASVRKAYPELNKEVPMNS